MTPKARLLVLCDDETPKILMINSANQKTVSIMVRILLALVFPHRLKRSTCPVTI